MRGILALALSGMWSANAQDFAAPQKFVKTYCVACHQGKSPAGGLSLAAAPNDPEIWRRVLVRVRNGEMPPKGVPGPAADVRETFVTGLDGALRASACAGGMVAGPYPIRRLNRDEYSATIRDLLNVQVSAGHALPSDGAGGEGFDNAAETLFISPIHAEKYLDAAREALNYAFKEPKSRALFLIAKPEDSTPEDAARKILDRFVMRAFRKPLKEGVNERYLSLFRAAQKRGENFEASLTLAMEAVLLSPEFLFRYESPNPAGDSRLADDYAMASRLSYFLWGSMPDQQLFDLAAKGELNKPETLAAQTVRMLKDERSREFAERFVTQWLGTRELGRDIQPDAKLFPQFADEELQSAIRYEPILFFREIFAENLSVLNLLDSNFTILTNKLQKHYGLNIKGPVQQPKKWDLPEGSHRGGILTMSAVLAVSSYPQRTSPVLRGKWILENILGTPPPPPPPNVPALKENHEGAPAATLRERLEQHRADPVCASCHNRIDPLGFALENYDVLGRWRTEDAGKPIDNRGELPDGTKIDGPEQLKKVLLDRKEVFLRNFTSKLLGYSLGRGLTVSDSCTVDTILDKLAKEQYSGQTLIREIVLSVPFRYQAGKPPGSKGN